MILVEALARRRRLDSAPLRASRRTHRDAVRQQVRVCFRVTSPHPAATSLLLSHAIKTSLLVTITGIKLLACVNSLLVLSRQDIVLLFFRVRYRGISCRSPPPLPLGFWPHWGFASPAPLRNFLSEYWIRPPSQFTYARFGSNNMYE